MKHEMECFELYFLLEESSLIGTPFLSLIRR
jgi:hypothetical protein